MYAGASRLEPATWVTGEGVGQPPEPKKVAELGKTDCAPERPAGLAWLEPADVLMRRQWSCQLERTVAPHCIVVLNMVRLQGGPHPRQVQVVTHSYGIAGLRNTRIEEVLSTRLSRAKRVSARPQALRESNGKPPRMDELK